MARAFYRFTLQSGAISECGKESLTGAPVACAVMVDDDNPQTTLQFHFNLQDIGRQLADIAVFAEQDRLDGGSGCAGEVLLRKREEEFWVSPIDWRDLNREALGGKS